MTGAADLLRDRLKTGMAFRPAGRVADAFGATVRTDLPGAAIGEICRIEAPDGGPRIDAEVIGFRSGHTVLAPLGDLHGLSLGASVTATGRARSVPVGDGLLGRVIDAMAQPTDGRGAIAGSTAPVPLRRAPPDPMSRAVIRAPFPVGIRAVDGLLTCGLGQRVGIFGEPGGGKSTLLASLVKGCEADVCVVALIGERGREVREFVEDTLGPDALARSVLVVATSDRPAVERASAAFTATAVAEHFRDQGKNVLLVLDSITRFARALRDIGLSAGELPTRRGFPSSVFAQLPGLLERAGTAATGSITAFYTVLVEGDGAGDPVAEEVRGILDGHIVLSADLAAKAHYPAIDIARSKSRLMAAVAEDGHRKIAARFLALAAKFREVEFLVQVDEYATGSDALADAAIERAAAMDRFLKQGADERVGFDATKAALAEAVA